MNPIPGYQLEAQAGHGRCSVVYRAVERAGGRKVALKVAPMLQLERLSGVRDFSREFDVLAAVANRHVVQAFSHGVHGAHAYLALEFAAEGPLARQGARLAAHRIHTLMSEAASALAGLHRRGWVHRDVKPANLLLRSDGSLVLADFGCARRCGEGGLEPRGVVVGTPRYAAPEQSQGAAAQPAADVYSLGVLLHQLLCGRPPFPGETLTELFGQHQLAPVPRLAPEHGAWQSLLDAMLAKAPGQRLADGHAVLHELQQLRKGLA